MVYVGTSGYGYHEWSPGFYPASLCYEGYLSHYAREFACCEINHTFFEPADARQLAGFLEVVPETFRFSVKLHRRLTHERGTDLCLARRFAEGLAPLADAGQLTAVLAQFPYSFVNNPHSRAYLCRLRAALELPLVVELRNPSWMHSETLEFMAGWGVGLVAIDAPLRSGLPHSVARATADVGYVRFHGRNDEAWWRRADPDRYHYRYRQRELLSWLPRLREIHATTKETFVVFNNHRHGHAWRNARAMIRLLERSAKRLGLPRSIRAG